MTIGDEAEVRVEAAFDLVSWTHCSRGGGQDRLLELAAHVGQQLGEQLALGAEVLVQHRLGDAGSLGDLVHRRPAKPLLGKRGKGAVEQLAATFGSG